MIQTGRTLLLGVRPVHLVSLKSVKSLEVRKSFYVVVYYWLNYQVELALSLGAGIALDFDGDAELLLGMCLGIFPADAALEDVAPAHIE